MTDNEIVKALECCNDCNCGGCPCLTEDGCKDIDYSVILDLINRLQAENGVYETCNARKDEAIKYLESEVKRLQAENERLKTSLNATISGQETLQKEIERLDALLVSKNKLIEGLDKSLEYAKAEAYKEFAERLDALMRDRYLFEDKRYSAFVTPEDIKFVLKELVEQD